MASLVDDPYQGNDEPGNGSLDDSINSDRAESDATVSRPDDTIRSDTDDDYAERVREKFNEYIEQARTEDPSRSNVELTERAYAIAEIARENDKNSTDLFAAAVEHYAMGVHSMADKNWAIVGFSLAGSFAYDGLKAMALGLKGKGSPGMADFLRAGNRPISEPTWRIDSIRGVLDGLMTDFSKSKKSNDQKNIELRLMN
jgi:hypothetical protein